MNKGGWSRQEDEALFNYITTHGEGKWRKAAQNTGLKRSGKSCRQRWLNYLKPGIKRGDISSDEEDMIIRLHRLLGNRWSLIAKRLPGRTDNEIKNYWNTVLSKKLRRQQQSPKGRNIGKSKTISIMKPVTPKPSQPTRVWAFRLDSKRRSHGRIIRPSSSNQIEGTVDDDHALSNFLIDDQIDQNQVPLMSDELKAKLPHNNDDEEQNKVSSENIRNPLDSINLQMELKRMAYFLGVEDECR